MTGTDKTQSESKRGFMHHHFQKSMFPAVLTKTVFKLKQNQQCLQNTQQESFQSSMDPVMDVVNVMCFKTKTC